MKESVTMSQNNNCYNKKLIFHDFRESLRASDFDIFKISAQKPLQYGRMNNGITAFNHIYSGSVEFSRSWFWD